LFSCHHTTYLLDTFGFQVFGILNEISSLMAVILGFTSYTLQLLGLETNFAIPFLPIGLLVLVSLVFPVTLRRRVNRELVKGEYYETCLTHVFKDILSTKPPGLVLDIGMNIGW